MPRKSEVSLHPDKAKIDKALIKGQSYRTIAKQFGLSQASLQRYMTGKLIPQVSKAQATRELQGGSDLLDRLESYIRIADKMIKAAEEYLQDPDDPDKLHLGPRADEVKITYIEREGDKSWKRKSTLQQLIKELEDKASGEDRSMHTITLETRQEDPRRTILNAANTLSKQLELFARIHGDIKNVSLNLTLQPAFNTLVQNLIDITVAHPETRREIVNAVKLIRSND